MSLQRTENNLPRHKCSEVWVLMGCVGTYACVCVWDVNVVCGYVCVFLCVGCECGVWVRMFVSVCGM